MAPPQLKKYYVDDDGKVHSPIHYHKEAQLPFYRVLQDFGFKGKLFGVNISVFPMYEYENDIMAKSFNANNDTQYLLGIKIMKNTKIKDFVKNVNLCGASLNILPLEYTIASKQGAIKDKYYKRFDKDKEDIEYILNHKEELGIDDNLLQEVLDNEEVTNWTSGVKLKVTDLVVEPNKRHDFTLERRWLFESGNDQIDTYFGQDGGQYSIYLNLSAEQYMEE